MTSSLATRHKADQTMLARLLTGEITPFIVPTPRAGLRGLVDTLAALTSQYHRASSSLAASYFEEERAAAGIRQRASLPIADPNVDALVHSIGWATRDLPNSAVDLDAVLERVDGASTRHALAGGRSTIAEAAEADPKCRGYVRVAQPGACAFCAVLAIRVFDTDGSTRGVYTSRDSAQRRGRNQTEDKYHDHCRCTVQAIFRGQDYEPPAHVQEWADIYARTTGDVTGKDKLAAFRAALRST